MRCQLRVILTASEPCPLKVTGLKRPHPFAPARKPLVDLSQYLPILLFLGVALILSSAFVFLPMAVGRLTGSHKPNEQKLSEYECGFPAFEDPRSQYDVRF